MNQVRHQLFGATKIVAWLTPTSFCRSGINRFRSLGVCTHDQNRLAKALGAFFLLRLRNQSNKMTFALA